VAAIRDKRVAPAQIVAASRAVRERIERMGMIEARVLEPEQDDDSVAIHGGAGIKVGGGWSREDQSSKLLAAASRGMDGNWITREDCVASAMST
jgi:hypothetical protein